MKDFLSEVTGASCVLFFFTFACYHIEPHCLFQSVSSEVCKHSSVVRLVSVCGCDHFPLPARGYRFHSLSCFSPSSSDWDVNLPSRWEIKFAHVFPLKFWYNCFIFDFI